MKHKFPVVVVAALAGCVPNSPNSKEQNVARDQLGIYLQAQPVPQFATSQLRQNLIEIETAQAKTTVTTSFFFNLGIQDPIAECPSIGFPIPSTAQLTNPLAKYPGNSEHFTVNQAEATGVYTGDSTGTYVICVAGDGSVYANYWEGFVSTVTGPASWNLTEHRIELTGNVTGGFTTLGTTP